MDQLSLDCAAAKRLGLSYGNYIALYKPKQPAAVRHPKQQEQEQARGQQKRPLCAICGAPILQNAARRKYCSAECSDKAVCKQRSDANRRRREAERLIKE